MFLKTRAEAKCDFITALQWAVNAKYSFSTVHGFSPLQLVFGRNPRSSNVLTNRLPALQNISGGELVSSDLRAMQDACKAFIARENQESLKAQHKVQWWL